MKKRHWYKRYPSDFLMGVLCLSFEEKCAYSICLDLIYDRGGPIPDDAQWLANVCGISTRRWRSLRDSLVKAGKLFVVDGMLFNERAERELVALDDQTEIDVENGAKGGRKRAENAAKTPRKPSENDPDSNDINGVGQAKLEARARSYTEVDVGGDAHASPPAISQTAHEVSDQIAVLCGHDLQFIPPAWCGAPMRVQAWLTNGWQPEIILVAVRRVIAKLKDPTQVNSVKFFERTIAEEHARQDQPLPNVIQLPATTVEVSNEQTRSGSRSGGLGGFASIAARLRAQSAG